MEKYDVFISYRHGGSNDFARLIHVQLCNKYSIFLDSDAKSTGELPDVLSKRIEECTDFIFIIANDTFVRTLNPAKETHDWVEFELKLALEKNKNVIPILIHNAKMPSGLPKDLERVTSLIRPEYNVTSHYTSFLKELTDKLVSKPIPSIDAFTGDYKTVKPANRIRLSFLQLFSLFFQSLVRK